MFENIVILYRSYGGVDALLRSSYFWIALIISTMFYGAAKNVLWPAVNLASMPSITGFAIASFAIIFAVLDKETKNTLIKPKKDAPAPLIKVTSGITHTIFIQTISIIFSALSSFHFNDSNIKIDLNSRFGLIEFFFSWLGLFFTVYGYTLVVATILSIFRLLHIISDIRR